MADEKRSWMKSIAPLAGLVLITIVVIGIVVSQSDNGRVDFTSPTATGGTCNVGVMPIIGYLDTQQNQYSNQDSLSIAQGIRSLALNRNMQAIVLLIDTPGGTITAAEEISEALEELEMPNVAFVRGAAFSGGYWIAASSDHIVARRTTSIGSIGVTGSYLEETELNKQKGYIFREIASGDYKEVGNVNKELTDEYKTYLQAHNDELFRIFAELVKKNRNMTEDDFAKVSDGRIFTAEAALKLGLIDEVGGLSDVKKFIGETISVSLEKILLCEPYRLQVNSTPIGTSQF